MLPVHEDYATYVPPRWVRRTVKRLLSSLSTGHLNGLGAVVLTDSSRSDRRKRRQMRTSRNREVLGTYHHAHAGESAWIEIVVDRVVTDIPRHFAVFQWARDLALGHVLFHEVGHHLHETVGSAARGGEGSAEAWRLRLSAIHFRRRYWYLRPLRRLLARFASMMGRRARRGSQLKHR